jgi:mono/diheme cytochrome c family protein
MRLKHALWMRQAIGFGLLGILFAIPVAIPNEQVRRGAYLASIMDCAGCHTTGALVGRPDPGRHLAGSNVGFQVPGRGIFYPPNLTPDPVTGLGRWSDADIVKAIRTGERPDGRVLAPIMPYHNYAKLTDADTEALVAYLRSLMPTRHQTPAMVGAFEMPTAPYLALVMPRFGRDADQAR